VGELAIRYGPKSLEASLLLNHRWGVLKLRRLSDESIKDPLAKARETYLGILGGADLLRFARVAARVYGTGWLLAQRVQAAPGLESDRAKAERQGRRVRKPFRTSTSPH
jgi:hypothetical protein